MTQTSTHPASTGGARPDAPVLAMIGLGGNLGNTPARLRRAIVDIDRLPRTRTLRKSSFYLSLPMGSISQPLFVNAVLQIRTRLSQGALLDELQKIERRFGRVRQLRWGPRTLDLDILVYDDIVRDDGGLSIPHPGIPTRGFVLYPLMEINPHLHIPGMGTPASLIRSCPGPTPRRI